MKCENCDGFGYILVWSKDSSPGNVTWEKQDCYVCKSKIPHQPDHKGEVNERSS